MRSHKRSALGRNQNQRRAKTRNRKLQGLELLESRSLLSIVPLNPMSHADSNATGMEPQSKIWQHNGQWWGVLETTGDTSVYRLSNSTWTRVFQIAPKTYPADVKPIGNGDVVDVFLYQGHFSKLAQLTFVNNTYQLKPLSPTKPLAAVPLTDGSSTATIEVDPTGRMWVASNTSNSIEVRYADAPYTTWSAPITLASMPSGSQEISAVVHFANKIGVMWSNHTTQRFGFRFHVDGTNPTLWGADEVPASQSARLAGHGMADNHLNIKVAANGTLYAAVKTAYDVNTQALPEMALLVRRPGPTWDPLYGIAGKGTQPLVELNEAGGFLRYFYTSKTNVGDIVYKDIPFSQISPLAPNRFYSGRDVASPQYPAKVLMAGGTFRYPAGTKQPFGAELVIVATKASNTSGDGPYKISGVRIVSSSQTATALSTTFVASSATSLAVSASQPTSTQAARDLVFAASSSSAGALDDSADELASLPLPVAEWFKRKRVFASTR